MRYVAVAMCALALIPAGAGASITLTKAEAARVARASAEQTLAPLDSGLGGQALVRIKGCNVHARRGRCRVVVNGLQRCTYVAHVLEMPATYKVWATNIRCSSPTSE
jgi:hypothetical protein